MSKKNSINHIVEAFDALVQQIAADHEAYVLATYNRFMEQHGPGLRKQFTNSFGHTAAVFRAVIHPYLASGDELNTEHLKKRSEQYAKDQVAGFTAKLVKKLKDLDDVTFARLHGGGSFTIRGALGGRRVMVDQRCIINFSVKGTPFHQWPALIYVEGKRVSEKEFKELSAALGAAREAK